MLNPPRLLLEQPYRLPPPVTRQLGDLVAEHGVVVVATRGFASASPPPNAVALLGTDLARFERYTDQRLRRRLVASRWLMRACAAAVLDLPLETVPLDTDPAGRPRLPAQTGVDLSLSHTGDVLTVALTTRGKVGVDVESAGRDLVRLDLEPAVCGPTESAGLVGLSPARRNRTLLRLWTLKESYAKALGVGLALPFSTVEFRIAGDHVCRISCAQPRADREWTHASFEFPGGTWCAVALGAEIQMSAATP